jgi:hypothetical protein
MRPIKAIIADCNESLIQELESLLAQVWPDLGYVPSRVKVIDSSGRSWKKKAFAVRGASIKFRYFCSNRAAYP